ncbi:MAG: peptidoglycan-binding protein, partial [Verrucomicrobiaceae bacterium]
MPTISQLRKIAPNLSLVKAVVLVPKLNSAMRKYGIVGKLREAAFIAQLCHESGEFRYSEEIASGERYEGRLDLGNVKTGDGKRFKGRGYIQITGRANYAECGKALGYDLLKNPELLSQIGLGCLSAAWYWHSRGLNQLADHKRFTEITRK